MNARRAARELALLALFQREQHDGSEHPSVPVERETFQGLTMAAIRALSDEADFQMRTAADQLAAVSRYLLEYEVEHPSNLETPLDVAAKPVPIPTTREMVEKIEDCLQSVEFLSEALRLPELLALLRTEEVQEYALKLLNLVVQHQQELDEILNTLLADWRMDRLTRMDAMLLRLAAAEMKYIPHVDFSVSINEAVDLAKQFSGEDSYKLINGVLGALEERFSAEVAATGQSSGQG